MTSEKLIGESLSIQNVMISAGNPHLTESIYAKNKIIYRGLEYLCPLMVMKRYYFGNVLKMEGM